ncbi:hypothetical protein [Oceanobacillus sp. J11TS1]|uniref:hypothetical protein n=1 Tax=Oceanobacillus sp. J11TS1 TaxID=2807191 RepID=UPI001B11F3A1|nr:hypothetical protein [Oceanobacillus sp. J11TS1]GIO22250.1 hypothetical protein J11TS1_08310 [Oceanobacillus sp. J11TS1]
MGQAKDSTRLTDSGTVGMSDDEKDRPSVILNFVNERFEIEFKSSERIFFA